MSWQILITISVISSAFSTILQRILIKEDRSNPVAYAVLFQIFVSVIIGVIGLMSGKMDFPDSIGSWPNLILMVVLYSLGSLFLFQALKLVEASKFSILFSTRALFTVIASMLVLGERVNNNQLLGIGLILISVVLVTMKDLNFLKTFKKGDLLSLAAGLCFGFANTNDKFLLGEWHVYPYLFVAFLAPAILLTILNPSVISSFKTLFTTNLLPRLILLSGVYAIGAITFFYALSIGPSSSQIVTINLATVIATVLLSIFILKERENIPRKLIGAVVSFVGLLLLS